MNELVNRGGSGLIRALHSNGDLPSVPLPFQRDIFLFDTYVAGTSFIKALKDGTISLSEGEEVSFFREPENRYDANAIVIKTAAGVKIGYVPRADNAVFSRLMDAGKLLFGKISESEIKKGYPQIGLAIYLRD